MKSPLELKCLSAIASLGCLLFPLSTLAQAPAPAGPDKKPAPRPHRVITNDDIPSRTVPNSTPETEARLEQLNFCDRTCFAQVFKDSQTAFRQRYHYPYPFSNKDDRAFEDAILNRMDSLRHNTEWQTMLRNALLAEAAYCRSANAYQEKQARERVNGKPITARDLAEEEAMEKNSPSIPNYGAATSAIIAYKFKVEKDFLLAAIILYKYFEIVKTPCSGYFAER